MKRRKKLEFNPELDTKDFSKDDYTRYDKIRGILRGFEIFREIDYEIYHRLRTYEDVQGNVSEAARRLNIDESTLREFINKFIKQYDKATSTGQSQQPLN